MTVAPLLQRSDQASTTQSNRSPTQLTCGCLTAGFAVCPAELPKFAIRTIPPAFVPA
jgi:hypothetical protein